MPSNVNISGTDALNDGQGYKFSGKGSTKNSGTITSADPNVNITITVTDGSGRCPTDYMDAEEYNEGNREDGWTYSEGSNGVYVKYISY
jgi:hypothetical protein